MRKTRKRYTIFVRKHLADGRDKRKIWRLTIKVTVCENMREAKVDKVPFHVLTVF
jgi:hypothetical protein